MSAPQADELVLLYGPGVLDPDGSRLGGPDESAATLDELRAIVVEIEKLERGPRLKRWAEYLRESRDQLAHAWASRKTDVDDELLLLEAVQGMKGKADQLREQLEKRAAELVEEAEPASPPAPQGVQETLGYKELPDLVCPPGWEIDCSGVFRLRERDGVLERYRIAWAPMLVTRRFRDLESGDEMLEVGWQRLNTWRSAVLPRAEVADNRALLQLAAQGAPVDVTTARGIVSYLAAVEAHNLARLPVGFASRRMGWLGKSARYFLAGSRLIHAEPGDPHEVRFLGEEGMEQLASAVAPAGTWEGWVEAVHHADKHPSAYLAIYVGLAAPLLQLVDCPNFVVDWSGRSGRGKTTTVRYVASCWGLPEESEGYIRSWSATLTGIERTAAALNFLPTILDESNKVPERERPDIARVLYMLANGSGRMRGTIRGMQRVAQWRTIGASTGETRITEYSQDEGARARTICITGSPLGEHNSALAEQILRELLAHHGHAGPRLVRWLLEHRDRWPDLRAKYRALVESWGRLASSDMARRAAQYMALLNLAADLLHEELGVPLPSCDPLNLAWAAIQDGSAEADRGAAALHVAYELATSRPTSFWGRHEVNPGSQYSPSTPRVPSDGWLGAWADSGKWEVIGFQPNQLREHLAKAKFEPESILAEWKARGWLKTREKGRTYPLWVHTGETRLVVVRREALEIVGAIKKPVTLEEGRDAESATLL